MFDIRRNSDICVLLGYFNSKDKKKTVREKEKERSERGEIKRENFRVFIVTRDKFYNFHHSHETLAQRIHL